VEVIKVERLLKDAFEDIKGMIDDFCLSPLSRALEANEGLRARVPLNLVPDLLQVIGRAYNLKCNILGNFHSILHPVRL